MKSDETTSKRGGIGINHLTVRPGNRDDEQEEETA